MTEGKLPPPLPGEDTSAATLSKPSKPSKPSRHDDNDSEEEDSIFSSLIPFIVAIAVAYVGGWKISWGAFLRTKKALLMNDHGLLVRINDLYYGLGMTDRFFDAPFISWLCLIPLFAAFGFKGFVFGQGR